jgi:HTH-like domain
VVPQKAAQRRPKNATIVQFKNSVRIRPSAEDDEALRRLSHPVLLNRIRHAARFASVGLVQSSPELCRLVGQWCAAQRYPPMHRPDEDTLTEAIIRLAGECGRYGYRRITALLQEAGWPVGKDRLQRIWRREGKCRYRRTPRRAASPALDLFAQ